MASISRQGRLTLKLALRLRVSGHRFASSFIAAPIPFSYKHNLSSRYSSVFYTTGKKQLMQMRFYSSDVPSHVKVKLPALSPTMEMGTIVSWQKKEGDQLNEGDLLCEIETDKATMGFETPEEGYLAKIFVSEGTKDIPIGQLLCIIVENKEDIEAFKNKSASEFANDTQTVASPTGGGGAGQPAQVVEPSQPSLSPTPQPPLSAGLTASAQPDPPDVSARIKATPYARKVAMETGVDLSNLSGSGPGGRILAKDVDEKLTTEGATGTPQQQQHQNLFGVQQGSAPDYQDIPLSNMRRTIAKRLSDSKSKIPHYYLTSEIIIDDLLEVRKKLNELLAKDAKKTGANPLKLSINDFIIKASALSCLRVPEANSFFMETFIRQNNNVDVSVAVSTDVGLITPIIFNAHHKGVATISSEVATLAAKAREGKLQPHEFQGGTFTVSNLGMFGSVDHFTAIINPPQSCILAIGGAKRKLVPVELEGTENVHQVVTALKVTLSCDHRVVDGAVGAVWLRHFKQFLEKPHSMLL